MLFRSAGEIDDGGGADLVARAGVLLGRLAARSGSAVTAGVTTRAWSKRSGTVGGAAGPAPSPDDRPPANTMLHWAFDAMVGICTALIGLGLWLAFAWWRNQRRRAAQGDAA